MSEWRYRLESHARGARSTLLEYLDENRAPQRNELEEVIDRLSEGIDT